MFLILVIVVIVGILMTIRYMLSLRAEQTTRDLYESIYGDDIVPGPGDGGTTDVAPTGQEPPGGGDTAGGTGGLDDYSQYSDYDHNQ